jgi:hypothetical protein
MNQTKDQRLWLRLLPSLIDKKFEKAQGSRLTAQALLLGMRRPVEVLGDC